VRKDIILSEWFLFSTKWAIFQLYLTKKNIANWWNADDACFVLDRF